MAYGKVHDTIWSDEKIRALPRDAREMFKYLITSPHKNRLGLYVLDTLYAAGDLQWSEEAVRAALEQLVEAKRIGWDQGRRVVFLPNHFRHNTLENENVVKGALSDLRKLPDTPFLADLLVSLERHIAEDVDEKRRSKFNPILPDLRTRARKVGYEPPPAERLKDATNNGSWNDSETVTTTVSNAVAVDRALDLDRSRLQTKSEELPRARDAASPGNPGPLDFDAYAPTDAQRARARELRVDIGHALRKWRSNRKANGRTPVDLAADFDGWLEREPGFRRNGTREPAPPAQTQIAPPREPERVISDEERAEVMRMSRETLTTLKGTASKLDRSEPMPPATIDDPEILARREEAKARAHEQLGHPKGVTAA